MTKQSKMVKKEVPRKEGTVQKLGEEKAVLAVGMAKLLIFENILKIVFCYFMLLLFLLKNKSKINYFYLR